MLLAIGLAMTYAELLAQLGDADPLRRESAAQALGRRGHAEAVPALLSRAQTDDNLWVRARAARALGRLGDLTAAEPLRGQLERETEEQVRFAIAAALADLADGAGATELLRLLRHGSRHIRAHVAEWLIDRTGEPLGQDADAWAAWIAKSGLPRPNAPRIVDLSWRLSAATPMWPGEAPPRIERVSDHASGHFQHRLDLSEHSGTHLDAPAHFAENGATVDDLPAASLRAPACVLDLRARAAASADTRVGVADLTAWEAEHGRIPKGAVVIAYTGWDARWGDAAAYRNADAEGVMHFPGFGDDAIAWLLSQRDIAGVGIDTLSIDPGDSRDFHAHKRLLGAGRYALENLRALCELPPRGATITVGVLRVHKGSGAPARVLAEVP